MEKRNMTEEIRTEFNRRGLSGDAARLHALELFESSGFPTPKTEAYRFTPVTRVLEKEASWHSPEPRPIADESPAVNRIVISNGSYAPELSAFKDAAIHVRTTSETFPVGTDPFDQLNAAMYRENIQIIVDDHANVQSPLSIIHQNDSITAGATQARIQIEIGKQSSVVMVERTQGDSAFLANKSMLVNAAEDARVTLVIIQDNKEEISINNTLIHLANRSRANCFTFSLEGKLVRNNLSLVLDGQGIEGHLYGLYLPGGDTVIDNHTVVDHRQPLSMSNELYKGIIADRAKGIFNGKIFVRPQAQKTNAYQTNRNIILGDGATVNTKPQLEIWADDVKCSHGCTTGQLDEEALFYLRSRGISEKTAKSMMLAAFASEAFSALEHEPLRTQVEKLVLHKLAVIS